MSENTGNDFYRSVPILEQFINIVDPAHYKSVPADWFIAVTDVTNSTGAIDAGRYKEVNILGVSPIVALLNVTSKDALPFSFGGDGAVVCIPPELEYSARHILSHCKRVGEEQYGLELRAALIPVSYIERRGYLVKVVRYRSSDYYYQALFTGGGVRFAEEVLKDRPGAFHVITQEKEIPVDFSGLECRWKEIGNDQKEVITLLVTTSPDNRDAGRIYDAVIEKLQELYGFDADSNPVNPENLSMNLSISALMGEARFRTFDMNFFRRLNYFLKILFQIVLGKLFMWFGYHSSETDWGLYKTDLSLNSDFRKFDDMLRTVISGSREKHRKLESFLQHRYEKGELAYGIHTADSALITCMVFRYHRDHIHFIDGSSGGYVEASKDLKKRMGKR